MKELYDMKARYVAAEGVRPASRVNVRWGSIVIQLIMVAIALFLWQASLRSVDLTKMGDLGLVNILPFTYYLAIALLSVSFCLGNAEDRAYPPMLLLHVVALIFMLHSTPQLLYGTLRYSWAWKHVGIIDYIQRNGSVDPTIAYLNAYHNWPGFFALGALLTDVSGFASAVSYAGWAPVFFNLIDVGALYLIFRALTNDRRLVWLAIWVFYIANWVGQDYFSPQALNYFLYLVVIGVTLTWFSLWAPPLKEELQRRLKSPHLASWTSKFFHKEIPEGVRATSPEQRTELTAILVMIFIVIASSHQLTPFMMIIALVLLVGTQIVRARSLPILMAAITAAWIIFMAVAFLGGNLYWIVKSIGGLTGNISGNLLNLANASPGQVLVSWMDRGLTALVIILAVFGFLRRLRNGYWDVAAALLVFTPIPMVVANAYGGEMVFRVYFFGLPFLAFFVAGLIYPTPLSGHTNGTAIRSVLLSLVLLSGFFFGYYGKEEMFYFSKNEVQAATWLNNNAPKGSILVSGTADWPLMYRHYEWYDYEDLADLSKSERLQVLKDPVTGILSEMSKNPVGYMVISRSQMAQVDVTGILPRGSLLNVAKALSTSSSFQLVYSNADTVIYMHTNPGVTK